MQSLSAFNTQLKNPCPVCAMPKEVQAEVEQGNREGIGVTAIIRWLEQEHQQSIGVTDRTRHAVMRHLQGAHGSD